VTDWDDRMRRKRERIEQAIAAGRRVEVYFRVRAARIVGCWRVCRVLAWHRTRATVVFPVRRRDGVDLLERRVSIEALREAPAL
jgi:hypothetical protein